MLNLVNKMTPITLLVFGITSALAFFATAVAADTAQPSKTEDDYLDGHALKCFKYLATDIQILEVLPGIGWDNIQNLEISQILDRKYFQCKVTEDRKYLIPDDVFVIPIKRSSVDVFAEWIDSMNKYKSIDSFSINGGLSLNLGLESLGVSGSFSIGYQNAKMHMSMNAKSKYITRVQARYNRYRIVSNSNAVLHPSFKARILDIAAHFYNNHNGIANYLCQLLIRDYGTHVLTRTDAGAVLFKEDHIEESTNHIEEAKKRGWQLGAGLSFNGIFDGISVGGGLKFGISKQKMQDTINEYNSKTSYSVIKSLGGDYFGANTTAAEWRNSLDNELVAVDRDGIPLFELVSSSAFPELPQATVLKVGNGIKEAFRSYYQQNTYRGCMDPRSKKI